jgi:hypothetical protein
MATPDFDGRIQTLRARLAELDQERTQITETLEFLEANKDVGTRMFAMFAPAEEAPAPTKRGRKAGKTAKKATAKKGGAKKGAAKKSTAKKSGARDPLKGRLSESDPAWRAEQIAAREKAAKASKGGGGRKTPGVTSASGKEGA